MSTNEDEALTPEQANNKWNLINQPSNDYSKASDSKITTPDEDLQKLKVLSDALGVTQQREEIDKINQSLTYLAGKMQEVVTVVDKQSEILRGNAVPVAQPATDPQMDKLTQLGSLVENLSPVLDRLFPKNTSQPLIDNSLIEDKMKQTFFDNLETGESINQFIKNSLKKSVTKNVINTSLKDIGNSSQAIDHGPI